MKRAYFIRLFQPLTTSGVLTLALLSALLLVTARPVQAQSETVLYNFCSLRGTCPDGAAPYSRLTADGAGNLYGTTDSGSGPSGSYGDVFELSPNGSGGWNETVIHTFTGGEDGEYPEFSPLIFDSLGNFYGTTWGGGTHGQGAVFEFSPAGASWTETVIYSFCSAPECADGTYPASGVIMDSAGNLYGTTSGSYGGGSTGIVFELSPSGGGWTEQVIYSFENLTTYPQNTGLTMDGHGNIFGAGYSTVFELSPNGKGGWMPTVIHTFTGAPKDGSTPQGTLVLDEAGNLYGTTSAGGTKNSGTVYMLSPVTEGNNKGTWKEKILHSFGGGKDGSSPFSALLFDTDGNIYGTTFLGGNSANGTVFELTPQIGESTYKERVLWSFDGEDGSQPVGSLILDGARKLYGTTHVGGSIGFGTAFEVNVPAAWTTSTLTSLPNPSTYGQGVTFTAAVTSSLGTPPDGEIVTFMKGTTVLGTTALSGGSASFTTSVLPVSTNSISATYGGDSNFGYSTSNTVKQVVNKATAKTTLVSSLNPSNVGQSVTFTASVTPEFSGMPTGTVSFYDGTTLLKTAAVSGGAAEFTTSTLTSGMYSITATYNGSTSFDDSSASLTQTVNIVPTLTSIAVAPSNSVLGVGASEQFTAYGTYSDGSSQNITSSVKWKSSKTHVATIASGGLATGVAAGTTTITAASGLVSGNSVLTIN
jgi:uncharacterized repeat protein (TIGR03803 family)